MHNLACLMEQQKRFGEARELSESTLRAKAKTLGHEHPSTLKTQASLVRILDQLGEDDAAEELARVVSEVRGRVLGAEHRSTLASKGCLATLLADKGDYQEASKLYSEILTIRERVQSGDHPETKATLTRLELVERCVDEETESIVSDVEENVCQDGDAKEPCTVFKFS